MPARALPPPSLSAVSRSPPPAPPPDRGPPQYRRARVQSEKARVHRVPKDARGTLYAALREGRLLVSPPAPPRPVRFHRSCCGPARTGVTDVSGAVCACDSAWARLPRPVHPTSPRASVGSLGLCSSSGLSSPPLPLRPRLRGREERGLPGVSGFRERADYRGSGRVQGGGGARPRPAPG